ncbi:unnamed protein product [Urochloa decumbens]|uniref:F-box domain-containing protein n=1 Tax=Urochloa decumbens TaxID=240449 RepID=A0ABC9GUB1_9POAL
MAAPPPALMEELVEESLLRLPPDDPASLVRASLVCKDWRRILTGPGFRRRFRERHRTPPMLGFLRLRGSDRACCFTATSSFRPRNADLLHGRYALDSRHGRVLLTTMSMRQEPLESSLAIWDPITGDHMRLPQLPPRPQRRISCHAAVLCASSPSGACNHLDCHRGPFLVVLMSTSRDEVFVDVYSSEAGAWSQPTFAGQHPLDGPVWIVGVELGAFAGNALHFMVLMDSGMGILKYNLNTREINQVNLPPNCRCSVELTTTEHGGLELASMEDSRLHLWSMEDGPDGHLGWAQTRVIELKNMLPANTRLFSVDCFVHSLAVVFTRTSEGLFSIDLNSAQVRKAYEGRSFVNVVPFMSFYTPELGATSAGEGSSAGA